jgi:hypothetical protein
MGTDRSVHCSDATHNQRVTGGDRVVGPHFQQAPRSPRLLDLVMAARSLVAVNVMHSVAVKLTPTCRRRRTTLGEAAAIALPVVEVMIDMPVEVIRAVIPGARADKYAAREPLRSVVSVRSAVVGRSLVISVRTDRRHADTYRYLRCSFLRRCKKKPCSNRQETERLHCFHRFPFQGWVRLHAPHFRSCISPSKPSDGLSP